MRAFAAKPVFFDMLHSNNAARIRLYLACSGLTEKVDTKWVTYATFDSEEFVRANPLKKVPAFINEDGEGIFESQVILEYVRDKYGGMIARTSGTSNLTRPRSALS